MNNYDKKVESAVSYIDSIYRIESMRVDGVTGIYGLEQHRINKHGELCDLLMIDRDKTKDICLNLDKSIGFDLEELHNDYEFWIYKYAQRLVAKLSMLL
jgi:hypothetical protein